MLRAAIILFIVALVAGAFGAYGVAGISMEAGRLLLYVFLALAIISAVVGLVTGRKTTSLP